MSSQIKFKRSLFGISKKPVVEYIESISKNIDDKLFKKDAEIAQLKKDIEILNMEKNALKKEISDFEEEKKKISDVFLKAEETARNTIEKANQDASNMLKPALARGELQCIGATTSAEYRKYFEKDAALERRFQKILVDEPTDQDTIHILEGLKPKYEKWSDLIIEHKKRKPIS